MSPSSYLKTLVPIVLLAFIFSFPANLRAQEPATPKASPSSKAAASSNQVEIEAMKADLTQMRVILNQMANNLAFVSDSQSPLKHQFQLDIDMWQLLLMQMQRRVNRLEGTTSTSSGH